MCGFWCWNLGGFAVCWGVLMWVVVVWLWRFMVVLGFGGLGWLQVGLGFVVGLVWVCGWCSGFIVLLVWYLLVCVFLERFWFGCFFGGFWVCLVVLISRGVDIIYVLSRGGVCFAL